MIHQPKQHIIGFCHRARKLCFLCHEERAEIMQKRVRSSPHVGRTEKDKQETGIKSKGLPGILGATESDDAIAVRRRVPVPVRRTEVVRLIAPRAPTEHPVLATRRPLRIPFRTLAVILLPIPIRRPLPHIARHIIDSIGAFSYFFTADGCQHPIFLKVATLSEIRIAWSRRLISPRIDSPIRPSGGFFPLGLCRQA